MAVGHQDIRPEDTLFHHPMTIIPQACTTIKYDTLATTRDLDTGGVAAKHHVFRGWASYRASNTPKFHLEPHQFPLEYSPRPYAQMRY